MRSEAVPNARRRTPVLLWLPWALAVAILALLSWGVAAHLSSSSSMAGMHPAEHALFRGGSEPGTLGPLLSSRLVTEWQLDAVALAVLVLAGAWYLTGVALANRRHPEQPWPVLRTASFLFGLGVCAFATSGSIAVYDQVLFSAHMLGHLALVMVAPIFLMAGSPIRLATRASNPRLAERIERIARGRVMSVVTAPPVALACYAVVIVGSHLTGLMDQIMLHTWAGQIEHLVYVVVGCQFFILVVGDEPIRWRLSTPGKWVLLVLSMAVDTFTGVVLMQTTSPISMLPGAGFAVDPLSDTHTGGSIMWFGGDGIMAVVMIVLVVRWLNTPELRTREERDSWVEHARRATFTEHTGASRPADESLDDDEAARAAYNEWLSRLHGE